MTAAGTALSCLWDWLFNRWRALMSSERTVTISIVHRNEPRFPSNLNVSDIDIGGLITPMLDEPERFASSGGQPTPAVRAKIGIAAHRHHEWRYIVEATWSVAQDVGPQVAAQFATAVVGAIAGQIVTWAVQVVRGQDSERPESGEDRVSMESVENVPCKGDCVGHGDEVFVDPSDEAKSQSDLIRLLDEVSERGGSVEIRFPPMI